MSYARAKSISVANILKSHPEWGIPHFQRGSVWGADNVSRLLESLYHGTPCGSIILWKQDQPEFGVPLVGGRKNGFNYLVIDGQQRTRSLIAAFCVDAMDENDAGSIEGIDEKDQSEYDMGSSSIDSQAEATLNKYWSVNLERVPEFKDILKPDAKAAQAPMFVLVEDLDEWTQWLAKRKAKASESGSRQTFVFNKPHLKRSVPLKFFFTNENASSSIDPALVEVLKERLKGTVDLDVLTGELSERALNAIARLSNRVWEMRRREFFLSILKTPSLSEVIDVFIRINSGGRSVDEEERAYSQLLRVCPENRVRLREGDLPVTADGWINSIFEWVHGVSAEADGRMALAARDQVLTRANERALGFKFFLRTFILAASYHSRTGVSRKAFSFNVLYQPVFLDAISNGRDSRIWSRTRDVVVAIAELIRSELYLDSFRFLPGARVLWPVMMTLIRFPGIMKERGGQTVCVAPEYRKALSYVILKLTLANPTDRWLLDRVVEIAGVRTSARDAVDDLIRALELQRFESLLDDTLREANSLQSMPVLMMYGLERSKAARDFCYRNYGFAKESLFDRTERVIGADCQPEKQHIVPYSLISAAYDLESIGRISSHPINNVGNITYLSHDLNGLDGLAQTLLNFNGEPPENLAAHCLGERSLELYRQICDLLMKGAAGSDDNAALKVRFEQWTESRRVDIRQAFLGWLDELKSEWHDSLMKMGDPLERIEPEAPVLMDDYQSLGMEYLIRSLDLDNRLEDKLIEVFASPGWYCDRLGDGGLKLRWRNGTRWWISEVLLNKHGLELVIDGERHDVSFLANKDVATLVKRVLPDVVATIQIVQQQAKDTTARKRADAKARKAAKAQPELGQGK